MNRFKKIIALIMLSLSISLIVPEIIPAVTSPMTVEAATVKLNKSKATLIKGQTLSLKVTGTKSTIKWISSDKNIAAVSSKGKVTAKSKGKSTITAKIKNKSYKCVITVETPKLNKTSSSLKTGSTLQLKLTGTKQKITWKSSNTSIATINSKGKVTAKKAGKCTIYVIVSNKNYKCSITVKSGTTEPVTEYVWLSATGTKYHKISNCGRMNPNKARKTTKKEAIECGYTPCDKCF